MRNQGRQTQLDRRTWLQAVAGAGAGLWLSPTNTGYARASAAAAKPRIAAIVTEYRGYSHADVIVGRFVKGYALGLAPFWPRTQVVSMYVDH